MNNSKLNIQNSKLSPDMAPMLFASAITEDRPIKVFNHGNMSRDFTYIDDNAVSFSEKIAA